MEPDFLAVGQYVQVRYACLPRSVQSAVCNLPRRNSGSPSSERISVGRADLDAVHDRLAAAERLFALNDEMKREQSALEAKIAEMRSEATELSEAQERVKRLEVLANDLGRDIARTEGLQQAALAPVKG